MTKRILVVEDQADNLGAFPLLNRTRTIVDDHATSQLRQTLRESRLPNDDSNKTEAFHGVSE
jgi:hypothetical protein